MKDIAERFDTDVATVQACLDEVGEKIGKLYTNT